MTFPSLPSDNLNKLTFFGGILILIFISYMLQKKFDDCDQSRNKLVYKIKLNNYDYRELTDESTSLYREERKYDSLIKLKSKIELNELEKKDLFLLKNNIDSVQKKLAIRNRELARKNIEIDHLNDLFKEHNSEITVLFRVSVIVSFGAILFVILGYHYWDKDEKKRDAFLTRQIDQIPVIYKNCQSCGMDIDLDTKLDNKTKYCSHCYDFVQNTFSDPDETLATMKTKIQVQMNKQGIDQKKIKKHLKALTSLERWRVALKWV